MVKYLRNLTTLPRWAALPKDLLLGLEKVHLWRRRITTLIGSWTFS